MMAIPPQSFPCLPEDFDPDGDRDVWEREYLAFIRKWIDLGAINPHEGHEERRAFPRFKLKSNAITILAKSQLPVVDISLAGISFYSNQTIDQPQTIPLVLENTFQVEVEVVSCRKVESGNENSKWPYRVHCRFVHPKHAMKFLVLLNDLDILSVYCPDHD